MNWGLNAPTLKV